MLLVTWVKIEFIFEKKIDCTTVNCKLPYEHTQNDDHHCIQMTKELIDVKEGNSYVSFFRNNHLETTFDHICTYWIQHLRQFQRSIIK